MRIKLLSVIGIFALFIFVSVNIYSSQNHPKLFFDLLIKRELKSAVSFLKRIQRRQEFRNQLQYFESQHGEAIVPLVFEDMKRREDEITRLKRVLEQNKDARDVLVKIALLYAREDNLTEAQKYYKKAKALDPLIEIEELEQD